MDSAETVKMLLNAGGFATMAIAIFWLHLMSIRQFREEMREERLGFSQRNAILIAAIERQTSEIVSRLERLSERVGSRQR